MGEDGVIGYIAMTSLTACATCDTAELPSWGTFVRAIRTLLVKKQGDNFNFEKTCKIYHYRFTVQWKAGNPENALSGLI
jgi:hypothetical protein